MLCILNPNKNANDLLNLHRFSVAITVTVSVAVFQVSIFLFFFGGCVSSMARDFSGSEV